MLPVYGPLRRLVAELVPTWRVTRTRNLALLAFWGRDHDEPWLLITDLDEPAEVERL